MSPTYREEASAAVLKPREAVDETAFSHFFSFLPSILSASHILLLLLEWSLVVSFDSNGKMTIGKPMEL